MNLAGTINTRTLPLLVTSVLFALLFGFGSVSYDNFFSVQVFLNLLIDNAFVAVVAIGMTFVILTGGIDLSVGSIVALTTMVTAALVEQHHWSIWVVVPLVLAIGSLFGLLMGSLIHYFRMQPFIVTLGGMFLARGLCYVISIDSIAITDPTYAAISEYRISFGEEAFLSVSAIISLLMLALAIFLAQYTRFGRTVYAIGGNENSAEVSGSTSTKSRSSHRPMMSGQRVWSRSRRATVVTVSSLGGSARPSRQCRRITSTDSTLW